MWRERAGRARDMTVIERLYLRLYDAIAVRPRLVLGVTALAVGICLLPLSRVRVDMSFRPFFVDDAGDAAATAEFEAVFGQPSGAFLGVMIERENVLERAFLRELSAVSRDVEAIEQVSEVVSLARLAIPVWSVDGASATYVLPPEILDAGDSSVIGPHLEALGRDPRLAGGLLSRDGRRTLLLARTPIPLDDLDGRRELIREFKAVVSAGLAGDAPLRFVGLSVVEDSYARIVLISLARSLILTILALVAVLWVVFRRAAGVAVVMAGVGLATPMSLGILTLLGQDLTMINSMVPIMILIIGAADGIHMLECFLLRIGRGENKHAAICGMFGEMALPCLLTTLTTVVGFLSLRVAHITAIRDFGLNVAIGVVVVYLLNLVLIPTLLSLLDAKRLGRPSRGTDPAERWTRMTTALVLRQPARVALVFIVAAAAGTALLPRLRVDQLFNEEVSPSHPIRADQALLEREFGGFLGPEIDVRRLDGSSLLDRESLGRLQAYRESVTRLPGVLAVGSVLDYLPQEIAPGAGERPDLASGIAQLRDDPLLGLRIREVIDAGGRRAALVVRTADVGTRRSIELSEELEALAREHLGPDYRAQVVGQWWLAQRGLHNIVRDMLVSFATCSLLVLPFFALTLRTPKLVLISIPPNLLPMFVALAFMAATGISLRIGTAMVLAVALSIAIDDTTHLMVRLKAEEARGAAPDDALPAALEATGRPIVYSTLVLVLGFLTMLSNDLLAIRDMGLIAAVTLTVALLADLLLGPALFLLSSDRRAQTAVARRKAA